MTAEVSLQGLPACEREKLCAAILVSCVRDSFVLQRKFAVRYLNSKIKDQISAVGFTSFLRTDIRFLELVFRFMQELLKLWVSDYLLKKSWSDKFVCIFLIITHTFASSVIFFSFLFIFLLNTPSS